MNSSSSMRHPVLEVFKYCTLITLVGKIGKYYKTKIVFLQNLEAKQKNQMRTKTSILKNNINEK